MLPEEEEKYYKEGEEPGANDQIEPEPPKAHKSEVLADLIRKGLLMNGQVEHNEEVTTIDLHCRL